MAKPILRWAGGKRWLAPQLCPIIYAHLAKTRGTYFEPFLGGGAVALGLGHGLLNMQLADVCFPLVQTYRTVRNDPARVLSTVEKMVLAVGGEINKETYYKVRSWRSAGDFEAAARFLIINATGFNGLWRENQKGECNVPYGDRTEKHLPKLEDLQEVAVAFATATIRAQSFEVDLARVGTGDAIFADSPYYASDFKTYHKAGFTPDQQALLAKLLINAAQRDALVVATNSDCPEVRELYKALTILPTKEPRSVSADGKKRTASDCVLITNQPELFSSKS